MRVGTISLNINTPDFNYGAMLHSWAFQQYLLKQKFIESAEVIDYTMPVLEGQHRNAPFIDSIFHRRIRTACKQIYTFGLYRNRFKKFSQFVSKHLIVSDKKYIQRTLNDAKLDYDVIICESDVIWSPGFSGGQFDKSFFLALDSMKKMVRIAYAPSMANGDLNKNQEDELFDLLKFVDYISCRESYEKNILERFTDKKVTHVVDPVLLLDEEDYKPIIGERLIEERYILLYLPVNDNIWLRKNAEEYAHKNKLKIIEISTILRQCKKDNYICIATAGIEEFLAGIKYTECIFTNSFHAICFAAIFHKNFYAFSRAVSGKVEDICNVLGVGNRYFRNNEKISDEEVDYSIVDEKLVKLKEISKTWLKHALISSGEEKKGGGGERKAKSRVILFLLVLYMILIWEIRQYMRVQDIWLRMWSSNMV